MTDSIPHGIELHGWSTPDRCDICGMPGMIVEVTILASDGDHRVTQVHIACENNRRARARYAGARGLN